MTDVMGSSALEELSTESVVNLMRFVNVQSEKLFDIDREDMRSNHKSLEAILLNGDLGELTST